MKNLRAFVLLAGVIALSACSIDKNKLEEITALNNANAVGNAFTQALTKEYRDYVNREIDEFEDHADSLHFARKGLAAARGDMVAPEQVSDWNVLPGHAEELIVGRSRLIDVFARGGREMQPDLSAFAQSRYDCWIEEQEENFQPDRISACKSQFLEALAQLEAAVPLPPPPAPEPEIVDEPFDVDPAEPMKVENAKYIVFFDYDESTLTAGANSILDAAAEEAKNRQLNAINLVGHTDTSGSRSYNQKLSMKRANVVRQALIQRGLDPDLLVVSHRGEDELLVDTADGVREPANRRTEITFQ
ncbi:MAG: OmpA family protein [Alphaproteobacteria bacterium]|nr:OmpA family protein [Alphaproteobacteria bacterium]